MTDTDLGRCFACDDSARQPVVFTAGDFQIRRCTKCGVGTVANPSRFEYSERYFQGEVYADYTAAEPVLRKQFRREVDYLRRRLPRGASVLEVGSAYGYFLSEASRHFSVTGVEPVDKAREIAARHGVQSFHPSDPTWKQRGPFDAMVMFDVIEHLENPYQTLDEVAGLVKANGVIVLTTGDWGSLVARVSGRRWRLMTPPEHLTFFTKQSIRELLSRAGFEVERFHHPWKFVPLGLAVFQAIRINVAMLNAVGIPVNLFDAMRVVGNKRPPGIAGRG